MFILTCPRCRIVFRSRMFHISGCTNVVLQNNTEGCPQCGYPIRLPEGDFEVNEVLGLLERAGLSRGELEEAATILTSQGPAESVRSFQELKPRLWQMVADVLPRNPRQAQVYLLLAIAILMCTTGRSLPESLFQAVIALCSDSPPRSQGETSPGRSEGQISTYRGDTSPAPRPNERPSIQLEVDVGLVLRLHPDALATHGALINGSTSGILRVPHYFVCLSHENGRGVWLPLFSEPGATTIRLLATGRTGNKKWTAAPIYYRRDQTWTATDEAIKAAKTVASGAPQQGDRLDLANVVAISRSLRLPK